MPGDEKYEVIWNPECIIDLANYVIYAKTTTENVYEKTNSLLAYRPHTNGQDVKFTDFDYNGYKWTNVKNIIMIL